MRTFGCRPGPLALLAALLAAGPAGAKDFDVKGQTLRLDVTESLYTSWHADPGNGRPEQADYGEILSRLNLQASYGSWLLWVRLDSSAYVDKPQQGETLARPNCSDCRPGTVPARYLDSHFPSRLADPRKVFEKTALSWTGRHVEVSLGDSYVQLGRGLVLSLRKVDELGVDTTLLGARVLVRAGPFQGVVLGGVTNSQNVDPAEARDVPEPFDRVGGGSLRWRIADKLSLGVQAAGGRPSKNQSPLSADPDRYLRYGALLDAPRLASWLSAYVEYARRDDFLLDAPMTGGALYAALTATKGRATFLLEAKDYRTYEPWYATGDTLKKNQYQLPPTLERISMPFTAGKDISVGRLRVDFRRDEKLSLTGSLAAGEDRLTSVLSGLLVDAWASAELRWDNGRTRIAPLVEARHEQSRRDGHVIEQMASFELDAMRMLVGLWSLEAHGFLWWRHQAPSATYEKYWNEGLAQISLRRAPKLLLSAGYEFTTAPDELKNQHHFFNFAARWNFTSDTSASLFVGGNRAGVRCSGGLCTQVPAFQGVRLDIVAQY